MTRGLRAAGLAAGGVALLAGGLAAQVRGSLDVGAGTYRPDRAIPGGIASIAPALYYDTKSFRLGASGVYSDAPAGRWNFQGATMVQLRTPELGPFQLEATGQVELTRHFAARGAAAATAELRANIRPFRGTTLWAGRAGGSATTLGSSRPLRRNLLGASTRVGGVEVGLSVASSTFELMGGVTRDAASSADTSSIGFPNTPGQGGPSPATRQMSLTDAVVSTRWRLASLDLDMAVGRRFARNTPELTIWGVSASRSLGSNVALVAGAGRAGSDPVTAVPGSRYFVMGLRLKVGATGPAVFDPLPKTSEHTPFRIGPPMPAGREVVVRAPGASRVELAGDFTDWRPVTLQPSGDARWRTVLPIPPGLHRLAVRLDGGAWQAPPGSRPIQTEFGGEVTEIVVE